MGGARAAKHQAGEGDRDLDQQPWLWGAVGLSLRARGAWI